MIDYEETARSVAWAQAYADARNDGASKNDAEENADRYVRENFGPDERDNCCPGCGAESTDDCATPGGCRDMCGCLLGTCNGRCVL